MAAVFGAAEHAAEPGPLVIDRMLDEGGDGGVESHDALAAGDEILSDFFSSGSSKSTPWRVVEADGIELVDLAGAEHFHVVAEHRFVTRRCACPSARARRCRRESRDGRGQRGPATLARLITSMRRGFFGLAGAFAGSAASICCFCSGVSCCAA